MPERFLADGADEWSETRVDGRVDVKGSPRRKVLLADVALEFGLTLRRRPGQRRKPPFRLGKQGIARWVSQNEIT